MNQTTKRTNKYLYLFFILSLFIFNSCKKDIVGDDMVKRTDGISVFDLEALNVIGMQEIPGVGYTVLYSGSKDFTFAKVGSALINEYGQLISSNLYGGSHDDNIVGFTNDVDGSTYACGNTFSPELRLNTIPAPFVATGDAYLCKLDKNGSLVWQIGYSDTATGNFGSLDEFFSQVVVVGDSLYCFGWTQNDKNSIINNQYNPNDIYFDNWLVVFDKNGNFGSKRTLHNPAKSQAYGPTDFRNSMIKCANDDIIFVINADRNFGPIPAAYDTSCIITRYSPSTGSIVWTINGDKEAPDGDIYQMVELANGDLFCLNSFNSKAIRLSGSSGDLISTTDLDILEGQITADAFVSGRLQKVGDNLYLVGTASTNQALSYGINRQVRSVLIGSKPWLVKMDLDGNVLYSQLYEVEESGFADILQKEDGNLHLCGGILKYGTLSYSGFFLTVDSNGDLITTN